MLQHVRLPGGCERTGRVKQSFACGRGAWMLLCAGLTAVVIALGGCGKAAQAGANSTSTADTTASVTRLALHLDTGSYSVASPTTTISGTASRGSTVRVNSHRALLHGVHWSTTLHLRLGRNRVTVEASQSRHRATRKTITVTREETSTEIEAESRARETEAEAPEVSSSRPTTTVAPAPEETCTNGTYVNSAGNTVCRPEGLPTAPAGATAECVDGTYSFSESRSGTCSHHGGVARWLQ